MCSNMFKYFQKCSNMFKCVHNCVQMRPNVLKFAADMFKCAQICSNVLKTAQMCSNMFKSVHNCVQMCPIAFKCVQMCSNAVSSIMRSGQLGNRGFKPGFTSPPSSSTFLSALVFIHFLPPAWLIPPILLFPCYIVLATFYLDRLHQVVPPPSLSSPRSHFSLLLLFPTTVSSSVTNP